MGDHRRGGLVIVKALPEPLSAKAPEEVNIRVLSLVEKKVWRFLSIQFNEGVGLHFPQLRIDKINQVQEIIYNVQLNINYVDNLDKFMESAETIINENLNNFTWSHDIDVKHRKIEKWSESLKEDKCFLPQKLLKALNFI